MNRAGRAREPQSDRIAPQNNSIAISNDVFFMRRELIGIQVRAVRAVKVG